MNVIFIITGLNIGGAERQVCDLADALSSKNINVKIISLTGQTITTPLSKNISIDELKMSKNPFSFIKALVYARYIIKNFHPDIVHSHMVHANLFSRFLRIIIKIPVLICTAHSTYEGSKIRALLYRATDFLCDLTTNVSNEAVKSSIKNKSVPKNKIITMYNGIDIQKYTFNPLNRKKLRNSLNIGENSHLLLSVGRLTLAKDYPNLLYAYAQIKAKNPNSQLVIIGDGIEKENILNLSKKLGVSNSTHFLGFRTDVNEWMSAADIFILSSEWEGFGLVVAEAIACKCLVVATNSGGVKEVLNCHRFLVPIKDHDSLSTSVIQAINLNDMERKKIIDDSYLHVIKNFTLDNISAEWIKIYSRLLKLK
ncbi:glycosyltransferase [Providencia huaxiensis]|uniref:glycosyltransferase n=1 Tax=Providencia huaxiensis TaxID=2027290 RepID=UPI0032DB8071